MASEETDLSIESLQRSIAGLQEQIDEIKRTIRQNNSGLLTELQRQNEAHQASRASDIFVLQLLFSYNPELRAHFASTIDKFLNIDFVTGNSFLHGEMKTIKALAEMSTQPPENGVPGWFQGIIQGGKSEDDS
jgi:hypothetical protein